jgi:hypothetical protein
MGGGILMMVEARLSSSIASVDDVAELLLRTWNTRRRLVEFADLKGAAADDSTPTLVRQLLRQGGTEWGIRVLIDSQLQSHVLRELSSIIWVGEQVSYNTLPPENDPHAIREAICDLTRLLIEGITRGPRGIDAVAPSVPLLRRASVDPQAFSGDTNRRERELVEAVARSQQGHAIVLLGNEVLTMPDESARMIERNWERWRALTGSDVVTLDSAVAVVPGLHASERRIVLSHLRQGSSPRRFTTDDLPSAEVLVRYLVACPEPDARLAATRLQSALFSRVYRSVDEFLIGCLAFLLHPTDVS